MKRICTLACTLAAFTLSSLASGATPGTYIGIGVGETQVKTPDKFAYDVSADPLGSTTRNRNGFGGRAFGGFNFNKWVGLEAGYTKYARSIYVGRADGDYSSMTYYIHSYDFVGKGYIPLGDSGFNIYALVGIARVVQTINSVDNDVPFSGAILPPPTTSYHVYRNRPIYGLGINYNFMRHLTLNVEATQVEHFGSFSTKTTATPYLDLFSLNIAYNFC